MTHSKTRNLVLHITESQAYVIQTACEVLARLGIGQFRDALEHLPLNEPLEHDELLHIGAMLKEKMGVDGWYSSFSMHGCKVSDEAKIAWDLYQVVRRFLSWRRAVAAGIVQSMTSPRNWPEMMAVVYDDPLHTSSEPLAVMKQTQEE